jgi:thymidylate synthase (FAD)
MNVFMIAEPRLNWPEYNRFYTAEKLGDLSIPWSDPPSAAATLAEICGRLCYMSFGKGRKSTDEYLDNIISSLHFSVLEHANWTFIITGVSRSLTHELVRHRHFSYSQLSQRYVDHSEAEAVMPPGLEGTALGDQWLLHQARARTLYAKMVAEIPVEAAGQTAERKAKRGAARSVLTEATETKIAVTGNARAWREFIQKRNSPHADQEIRRLAEMLLERLWNSAPELFRDLKEAP